MASAFILSSIATRSSKNILKEKRPFENYPEIKWIKPAGYSIAALTCLSMRNNGVHWASDYPLGFALGNGFGKFISKKTRLKLVN